MGLFDGWQFDPKTYRPQGGVLDDLLRLTQAAQAPGMPQGAQGSFPAVNGQPEFSMVTGSLGSGVPVPTFGRPDPAALPQNAQPAQAQLQPQAAQPGFGDRLMAGLQGFGEGGRTGGLIGALTNGAQGLSSGATTQNQTEQALVAKGLDPAIAKNVARDPASLRALLPTLMGTGGQTDDIKEFNFAKQNGFQGSYMDWMRQKKSVSGEYSLTPQYGTNEKGETVLIQTGKNGEAIQTKIPDGVKISSGVEKIDAGTNWILYDKRTGQTIGTQPKDVAGAANQKAQGTAQGEAVTALPGVIQQAEDALKTIQQAKTHPGQKYGLGVYGMLPAVPNTDQAGFVSLVDQMQGRAFLQAYQGLKGTGSISEAEGAKAEAAVARLKRTQKPEDFMSALSDLEEIVRRGVDTARAKAKQGGSPVSAAPGATRVKSYNPATGKIE